MRHGINSLSWIGTNSLFEKSVSLEFASIVERKSLDLDFLGFKETLFVQVEEIAPKGIYLLI